ncbi:hypothetical protein [Phytohabitans flavus]|uniref:hypothetical protein n=1 Tax=Phytohabitans flavus TaxID=1076124 RepID=UPI0018D8A6BC|nr:hypothetical protein [Phytohabitans flavus]
MKYNALIESARPQLDREVPRDRFFRSAVFALFPYPGGCARPHWPGCSTSGWASAG